LEIKFISMTNVLESNLFEFVSNLHNGGEILRNPALWPANAFLPHNLRRRKVGGDKDSIVRICAQVDSSGGGPNSLSKFSYLPMILIRFD